MGWDHIDGLFRADRITSIDKISRNMSNIKPEVGPCFVGS